MERSPSSSPPALYYGRYATDDDLYRALWLQPPSSDDEEEVKKFDTYAKYSRFKYSRACDRVLEKMDMEREAAERRIQRAKEAEAKRPTNDDIDDCSAH